MKRRKNEEKDTLKRELLSNNDTPTNTTVISPYFLYLPRILQVIAWLAGIILLAIWVMLLLHRGIVIKYATAINQVCDIDTSLYEHVRFPSPHFFLGDINIEGVFIRSTPAALVAGAFPKMEAFNSDFYPLYDQSNSKGVIIVVHGHGTNMLGHLGQDPSVFTKAVCPLHAAGFNILTIDMRNHGMSGYGPPISFGIDEKHDILGAIEFAKKRMKAAGIEDFRVGLWGESMGGASVLLAAHAYQKLNDSVPIRAIVTDSAFGEFKAAITGWLKHKLPFLRPIHTTFDHVFYFASFFIPQFYTEDSHIQPCDAIRDITSPVLLAHGSSDPIVSIAEMHKLLKCRESKMGFVETFIHDGVHVAAFRNKDYFKTVADFYHKYLIES